MGLFNKECYVETLPMWRSRPTFAIVVIIAGKSQVQRAICLLIALSVRLQTGLSFCCYVACTAVQSLKANRFVMRSGRITMVGECIERPQIYVSRMSFSRSARIVGVLAGLLLKMRG